MEPFVYLALFLLVALASLFFRWLKAQIEEAPTDRLDTGPWTSPHRPDRVIPLAQPDAGREARRTAPPLGSPSAGSPPLPRQRPTRLAARGSVRDLRRGILWMAILGRCRGLEPPRHIAEVGPDPGLPARP